jgi:hypothetical protein
MGRSVSYPAGYSTVTFSDWYKPEKHDCDAIGCDAFCDLHETTPCEPDQWEWQAFMEDLQEYAPTLWPSLCKVENDHWIGNENRKLLENDHCFMGMSEYCGLAALWIVPKVDDWTGEPDALAAHWCAQIADKFCATFGDLALIGNASNGEAFYRRIDKE